MNVIGKRVKIVHFPAEEGKNSTVNPSMIGKLGTISTVDDYVKYPLRVRVDNYDYPNPDGSLFALSEVRYLNNKPVRI